MKNSLSKALICGVIASSFVLINCQKAGSGRGVKGTRSGTDTAKVTPTEKQDAETSKSFLIQCSPEFLRQYDSWIKTIESKDVKDIVTFKKDELTETQKENLNLLSDRIDTETKSVMSEFEIMQKAQSKKDENTSIQKKLDGCFASDGKSKTEYPILQIKEKAHNVALRISELTGVKTPAAVEGEKELAERKEKSLAESDVTKKASFYVSEELNQALDDTKIDDSFFMDGKVLTGANNLNKAKEDASTSVCMTTVTVGAIKDLNTTLDAVDFDPSDDSSEKVAGKKVYNIRFSSVDGFYTLKCVLPAAKKLAAGFAEAMGDLLQTKKQLAKKEKAAAEEKAKTEKEVVKEEKKDVEVADTEEEKDEEKESSKAKETKKEEVKSKTVKKSSTKPVEKVKKVKKIKITAKQKQEFLDEDLKTTAKEVEKEKAVETKTETKSDEVKTEEQYIPSHLRSK